MGPEPSDGGICRYEPFHGTAESAIERAGNLAGIGT